MFTLKHIDHDGPEFTIHWDHDIGYPIACLLIHICETHREALQALNDAKDILLDQPFATEDTT